MPAQKNSWSATPGTRVLSALPSKLYVAMYIALGSGEQARRSLNDLSKSLIVRHFLEDMGGAAFLNPAELEKAKEIAEVQIAPPTAAEMVDLVKAFKNLMDHDDLNYFVESNRDLRKISIKLRKAG